MPNITIVHAFFAKLMLVEVTLAFVNALLSEKCVWRGGGGSNGLRELYDKIICKQIYFHNLIKFIYFK